MKQTDIIRDMTSRVVLEIVKGENMSYETFKGEIMMFTRQ